ncbi:MAG: histidine kinase dimerization/phospho-acceptor domain-containing protein, partial [Pyrinomonadaceae bacterium]
MGAITDTPIESSLLENLRQLIFVSGADGYALLDQEGRVVGANSSFVELLGSTVQQAVGHTVPELLAGKIGGASEPVPDASNDLVYILRDGRRLRLCVENLAGNGPDINHRVGVLSDESVSQDFEMRLTHHDRLTSLGGLVAGLAHEIAAPLCIIGNNAELLMDDAAQLSGETRRGLAAIRDEAFRLGNLLREFLRFTRDAPCKIAAQDALNILEKAVQMARLRSECKR